MQTLVYDCETRPLPYMHALYKPFISNSPKVMNKRNTILDPYILRKAISCFHYAEIHTCTSSIKIHTHSWIRKNAQKRIKIAFPSKQLHVHLVPNIKVGSILNEKKTPSNTIWHRNWKGIAIYYVIPQVACKYTNYGQFLGFLCGIGFWQMILLLEVDHCGQEIAKCSCKKSIRKKPELKVHGYLPYIRGVF